MEKKEKKREKNRKEKRKEDKGTSHPKTSNLNDVNPFRKFCVDSFFGIYNLEKILFFKFLFVFFSWATISNPTRPRVADRGISYRYVGLG